MGHAQERKPQSVEQECITPIGANALLYTNRLEDALIPAPHHLYYFLAFLFPNCFLGILVQREIIANAFNYSPDFSPNHVQRYKENVKRQKIRRIFYNTKEKHRVKFLCLKVIFFLQDYWDACAYPRKHL